ncbi:hypothetical protein, partial [Bartonella sp. MU70NMGDW]|uniref:hypothetical protein n=1 Tax=Bartonella sp. MU70NMGDW TaxID=3243561 RepID=UPI0035CF4B92
SATKNEIMTKIKNKKNDNLIKKRIMDNQCTAVVNTIKEAFYTLFLYKQFIKCAFYKIEYSCIGSISLAFL